MEESEAEKILGYIPPVFIVLGILLFILSYYPEQICTNYIFYTSCRIIYPYSFLYGPSIILVVIGSISSFISFYLVVSSRRR